MEFKKIQFSNIFSPADIHRIGNNDCCIVFIHGFSESSECWNEITNQIKNKANMVTYDCIGHGNNSKHWQQVSFTSYVEQLGELINHLIEIEGFNQIILVGHSQGASIATQYVIQNPNLIDNLILISPFTYVDTPLKSVWGNFLKLIKIGEIELFWDLNSSLLLGPKSDNWAHFRETSIQQRLDFFSPHQLTYLIRALLSVNIEGDFSRLKNKLSYLIHGEYDTMFPNYYSKEISGIIHEAKYIEVSNANHLLIELEPYVSQCVLEVIKDIS